MALTWLRGGISISAVWCCCSCCFVTLKVTVVVTVKLLFVASTNGLVVVDVVGVDLSHRFGGAGARLLLPLLLWGMKKMNKSESAEKICQFAFVLLSVNIFYGHTISRRNENSRTHDGRSRRGKRMCAMFGKIKVGVENKFTCWREPNLMCWVALVGRRVELSSRRTHSPAALAVRAAHCCENRCSVALFVTTRMSAMLWMCLFYQWCPTTGCLDCWWNCCCFWDCKTPSLDSWRIHCRSRGDSASLSVVHLRPLYRSRQSCSD